MKKVIILSVVAFAFTIVACNNTSKKESSGTTQETTTGEPLYQCPMHPEVTSDKPGSCSKCGMDLQKVEKQ